jgi:hypothetical protein
MGYGADRYFTVEYRRRLNWDKGINGDGVVIHKVTHDFVPDHQLPLSYLQTRSANWWDGIWHVGETFGGLDYFHITVASIDPRANTATVVIYGPTGAPTGPPPPPPGDNGQGAGGCGATGCGQHPPGWKPKPIQFQ